MQLFLTIVAGIVVGALLLLFILYLLIKHWIRRTVGQTFDRFVELTRNVTMGIAPFTQPLRITLERVPECDWMDKPTVDRLAQAFLAAGFAEAGEFAIQEYPDIRMRAFAHPGDSVYAVIYEQPDNAIWFDIVSRYEDGAALTYTTAKPTGLDHPPNKVTERFEPGADPAEVYERQLARRPSRPLKPAPPEGFAAAVERAYAQEMDWRFERGGMTEDEIRNNLKLIGTDVTDDQVKQVHAMQQAQVGQWLQTKPTDNFRATSRMSDRKWEKIEDRVFFIHDRMTGEEVQGEFANFLDWDDEDAAQHCAEEAEKLAGGPPREAFARMIKKLPANQAPSKVGHLSQPVDTDVYLSPENPEDEED